ncbi:hypothetical protein PAXINDRAFT_98184 [Paxillus involutus ATCC 200175]|nr:hypothetical protein PAXINDRAFT_98184 [Paxillus involutus ATCC 200175]
MDDQVDHLVVVSRSLARNRRDIMRALETTWWCMMCAEDLLSLGLRFVSVSGPAMLCALCNPPRTFIVTLVIGGWRVSESPGHCACHLSLLPHKPSTLT